MTSSFWLPVNSPLAGWGNHELSVAELASSAASKSVIASNKSCFPVPSLSSAVSRTAEQPIR